MFFSGFVKTVVIKTNGKIKKGSFWKINPLDETKLVEKAFQPRIFKMYDPMDYKIEDNSTIFIRKDVPKEINLNSENDKIVAEKEAGNVGKSDKLTLEEDYIGVEYDEIFDNEYEKEDDDIVDDCIDNPQNKVQI